MSSRSLAAARARRAGENAPPVSGNRPGTSIGSGAAFSQQMPSGYQTNMPPPPPNVRAGRGQPQMQQYQKQPQQQYQQQQQQSKQPLDNGLPFTKLSISDAIGLITLRLGRVEQWIIETDHENELKQNSSESMNLPDNSRIIDNSVLSSIVNRLEEVEKIQPGNLNNEDVLKLSEEVSKLNELFNKVKDDLTKHTLEIAKNNEQIFKFNRELTETKDILKTFMIKYDVFASETLNKFSDYEFALTELEQNMQVPLETSKNVESENNLEESTVDVETNDNSNIIMSVDLKNIIKQELASTTD